MRRKDVSPKWPVSLFLFLYNLVFHGLKILFLFLSFCSYLSLSLSFSYPSVCVCVCVCMFCHLVCSIPIRSIPPQPVFVSWVFLFFCPFRLFSLVFKHLPRVLIRKFETYRWTSFCLVYFLEYFNHYTCSIPTSTMAHLFDIDNDRRIYNTVIQQKVWIKVKAIQCL